MTKKRFEVYEVKLNFFGDVMSEELTDIIDAEDEKSAAVRSFEKYCNRYEPDLSETIHRVTRVNESFFEMTRSTITSFEAKPSSRNYQKGQKP